MQAAVKGKSIATRGEQRTPVRRAAVKRPVPVFVAALVAAGSVAGCTSGGADKAGGLTAPVVAHGVYDALALAYLRFGAFDL